MNVQWLFVDQTCQISIVAPLYEATKAPWMGFCYFSKLKKIMRRK
jgi:hypothetical protein